MDVQKLTEALKSVHEYINLNRRDPSNRLEEGAVKLVKQHYPDIGTFNINVGYSDDLHKKLFYLDLPSTQQILIYSYLFLYFLLWRMQMQLWQRALLNVRWLLIWEHAKLIYKI